MPLCSSTLDSIGLFVRITIAILAANSFTSLGKPAPTLNLASTSLLLILHLAVGLRHKILFLWGLWEFGEFCLVKFC